MRAAIKDILQNEIVDANFSAVAFDDSFLQIFVTALQENTSIKNLNVAANDFLDEQLQILATALLNRKTSLTELNLDFNDLTEASFPILEELMKQKKISSLLIYGNKEITYNEDVLKRLKDLANNQDVRVSELNPRERTSPGFFERLKAKQNAAKITPVFEEKESPKP